MSIKKILEQAAERDIISDQQASDLWDFYLQNHDATPRFTFTHVLYYFGGFVAIGAMTLFMTLGWESFGGAGIVAISLVYAAIGLYCTHLMASKKHPIPAGICATFVICLTPLFVYGLQQWLGVWPSDDAYKDYHRYIKWHWIYMELATLAVGAILAWKYRYPFMVFPIAVTLWYMSMDVASMLSGGDYAWELRKIVSFYFGLLMIALAFYVDIRSGRKRDFAFWLYLFGVMAFWGGLSTQSSDSELAKFGYFCINLLMIGIGVLIVRRVFVIFGALGCAGYLTYLANEVFEDSWLFPISLTIIGLSIIYLGIVWQKHEKAIAQNLQRLMPEAIQVWLKK